MRGQPVASTEDHPTMSNTITTAAMADVAQTVARYYSRRVSWADQADVEQAAWVGVLEARATFNPETGPWHQYAFAAGARHAQRLLYQQRSPVTAGGRNRGKALLGETVRVSEDDYTALDRAASPEALLLEGIEQAVVRAAVDRGAAGMTPANREAAMAVLTEDIPPREAAARVGISPEQASWAVRRLRAIVKADPSIAALRQ
jgi:RNA polymerase sigma factor (sigma-70 family)